MALGALIFAQGYKQGRISTINKHLLRLFRREIKNAKVITNVDLMAFGKTKNKTVSNPERSPLPSSEPQTAVRREDRFYREYEDKH